MTAAPAEPTAAPDSAPPGPVTAEPSVNGRALPTLPDELAAAFDAEGEVVTRHPRTGERLRLVPYYGDGPRLGPPVLRTLAEAVEAARADVRAGRTVSLEEFEATRHERLAKLLRLNGEDPHDHLPPEVVEGLGS